MTFFYFFFVLVSSHDSHDISPSLEVVSCVARIRNPQGVEVQSPLPPIEFGGLKTTLDFWVGSRCGSWKQKK